MSPIIWVALTREISKLNCWELYCGQNANCTGATATSIPTGIMDFEKKKRPAQSEHLPLVSREHQLPDTLVIRGKEPNPAMVSTQLCTIWNYKTLGIRGITGIWYLHDIYFMKWFAGYCPWTIRPLTNHWLSKLDLKSQRLRSNAVCIKTPKKKICVKIFMCVIKNAQSPFSRTGFGNPANAMIK